MNDPNRPFKWLLVITLVALSIVVLYPPSEKLKGGIDLVGGSSLLYEIDTTGMQAAEQSGLSTRVMRVLKDRVDPEGQMNLEWRPVGNTRLEVRMPRPPKQALERRAAYNEALDALSALNIGRRDVEEALNAPPEERPARLEALVRGIEERRALIDAAKSAYDEYTAAQGSSDSAALQAASQKYEEAIKQLVGTSLPVNRLRDVLAIPAGEARDRELATLRSTYPSYDKAGDGSTGMITRLEAAYSAWAANKAELEDPSDLKRRLRGSGVLEFRILAERDPSSPDHTFDPARTEFRKPISQFTEQLQRFGPRTGLGESFAWFPIEDPLRFSGVKTMEEFQARRNTPGSPIIEEYTGRYFVLMYNHSDYGLLQSRAGSAKWALKSAYPDRNFMTGENVVSFQLDAAGGSRFGNMTGANIGRQLCILLDGAAMSHATIRERITERCQISGNFTPERVQEMVNTLEAGSLPARLKETPLFERTVGPSLGETNRKNGMTAAVWGSALVALFVFFYYGFAGGGIANMALMLNIVFVLAIMSLMEATFTLPGIAGLALTVGMAIDANVLIFERIREERNRGVVLKKAVNAGYDKALSAIVDSNITTLITCVILGFVASEEVKGFAITLGLGLVTSMFTALFCTRLAFNTLMSQGLLTDLKFRKLIDVPNVDWIGLRRYFLPVSGVVTVLGLGLFLNAALTKKEQVFDIEFLGGTSVQLDFRPGQAVTDEQVRKAITSTAAGEKSAVNWIENAAAALKTAQVATTADPSEFAVTAGGLSGEQIAVLVQPHLTRLDPDTGKQASYLDPRRPVDATGDTAVFRAETGKASIEDVRSGIVVAVDAARAAANKLRGARVQTVSAAGEEVEDSLSFEVVTVETNRPLVQEALLAVLGDRLTVQQAVRYSLVTDEGLTKAPYFVVESDAHYLSDVIPDGQLYDVRRYRGGVAVDITLDEDQQPMTTAALQDRIRQVGLLPEFEQFRTRDMEIFPLGQAVKISPTEEGYKKFAVAAVDESLLYDDNPDQWSESVAGTLVDQIEAALASEKSLTKVIQFAPQVAQQATNRALFATLLAMVAIGAYIWLRFGNRIFGMAVLVALVHDVVIVLGALGVSQYIYNTFLGRGLMIHDFKMDLAMIAAILTVIGYSLNDTIVVFDRLRENRGRSGNLNAALINESINQTMSRTILTSLTVFFVVLVLYIFGGVGVHGFAFAMVVGTISGTYSTLAIAAPLVHDPRLLARIMYAIAGLGLIGLVVLFFPISLVVKLILAAGIALGVVVLMLRAERSEYMGQPTGA